MKTNNSGDNIPGTIQLPLWISLLMTELLTRLYKPSFVLQDSVQTEDIQVDQLITNFMYESLLHRGHSQDSLNRAGIQQIEGDEITPERQLAQRLQSLVDSMPANTINPDLIDRLLATENTAYDVFSLVAQQVIAQGLSWGRIVAVFLFALELADRSLAAPGGSVLMVMSWLARFVISNLLNWIITEGGGWVNKQLQFQWWFWTIFMYPYSSLSLTTWQAPHQCW